MVLQLCGFITTGVFIGGYLVDPEKLKIDKNFNCCSIASIIFSILQMNDVLLLSFVINFLNKTFSSFKIVALLVVIVVQCYQVPHKTIAQHQHPHPNQNSYD